MDAQTPEQPQSELEQKQARYIGRLELACFVLGVACAFLAILLHQDWRPPAEPRADCLLRMAEKANGNAAIYRSLTMELCPRRVEQPDYFSDIPRAAPPTR